VFRHSPRLLENGSVSRSHLIFERNCASCHNVSFQSVSDKSCKQCHDGPVHHENAIGTTRCAECHAEHRGNVRLTDVDSRYCTRCHANLAEHGTAIKTKALRITGFGPNVHPEFSPASFPDLRPIRLNHAKHMPDRPSTFRGHKLPMQCGDCHRTDPLSPTGDLLPVTFQSECRYCHREELGFLLPQLENAALRNAFPREVVDRLNGEAFISPHTKNTQTIHEYVVNSYTSLVRDFPAVTSTPLERGFDTEPSADAWLQKAVNQAESYLFERKCVYCHTYSQPFGGPGQYPVVKKVNAIRGRYVENQPLGVPWLRHARFSHRAHRAVECSSCHTEAKRSTKTEDVLIPVERDCLPCHGTTGTAQDYCSQCHIYHDKSKELQRDRQPVKALVISRLARFPH